MHRFIRPLGHYLVMTSALTAVPAASYAETDDAAATNSKLEEILVTARGRMEQLQWVPDSVTAFSSNAITTRNIRSLDDAITLTPGVHIVNDQDPGTNIITVRGVSTDRLQAPSIAMVVDGVPLADTEFFEAARLYDLDRIEILKGPQGALYGKNAIGGVFNIATRSPSETWQGNGEVSYGNGDSFNIEGGIGGPIVEDKLLIRVSGAYYDTNGFIYNTFLKKNVDYFTSRNGRLRLLGKLSDTLTAELRVSVLSEDGGAAYVSSNNVTGLNNGKLQGAVLTDPLGDFEGQADREWQQVALTVNWEPTFGGRITSTSAYDNYSKDFIEELDFRNDKPLTWGGFPAYPDGVQPISQPKDIEVWTQELRYTSPDDKPVRWIVGAFIQDVTNVRVDDFGPLLFGAEASRFRTKSTQTAVFGQVSVDITPSLEATAALRYDRDDRRVKVRGVNSGAFVEDRDAVFDQVQPKLSLAYRIDDNHLLYGTYAHGFKTGGFNPPAGPGDIHETLFRPEKTQSFEVGSKSTFANGRVVINTAAFITNYDNYQYFAFINGKSLALNVKNVDVWGFEFSTAAQLFDGFTVNAAYGYTNAEIKDFSAPNPVSGLIADYDGMKTPNNPKSTLNIGGEYRVSVGALGDLVTRLDYTRIGRIYYEIDNVLYSPKQEMLDARIAFETETWSFAIWGKNLTDNRWAISAFGQGQQSLLAALGPGGPFDSFTINKGRQYGATLSARF